MKIMILSLILILFPKPSLANLGIMFSGGKLVAGDLETTTSRHALFWKFNDKWFTKDKTHLTWQLELASSHWNNKYFTDIDVISLTPVFHYVWQKKYYNIFAGGGFGIAKLNGKRLGNRKLGSKWLFDNKLVLGIEIIKNHRFSLSANHYSNADLAPENDGLNVWYVNYSYRW
jgi:lipid A 3-O-deacylase